MSCLCYGLQSLGTATAVQTRHCRPGDCTERDLLASAEQESPDKVVCSIVLCYSPSIVKINNLGALENDTFECIFIFRIWCEGVKNLNDTNDFLQFTLQGSIPFIKINVKNMPATLSGLCKWPLLPTTHTVE